MSFAAANSHNHSCLGAVEEGAFRAVAVAGRHCNRLGAVLADHLLHDRPTALLERVCLGPQPFDKLTREMRPQDPFGDGRDWHGGDEPENIPQTIKATDTAGRWAIYVPLTRGGKIVVPRPYSEAV
jgi:hypothetical protein